MSGVVYIAAAYGPWIVWLAVMLWLGWKIPGRVEATGRPFRDAGRRIAYGALVLTLLSLPVVYLIASFQESLFGGRGLRWAEPQVLLATVVVIAPAVYVPLLAVRTLQLWLREGRS